MKYQNLQNAVLLMPYTQSFISIKRLLSSSRTSVRVKLGLFSAKIRKENRCYIHRLIYQINEQDLLCHSIYIDCIFDLGNIIA